MHSSHALVSPSPLLRSHNIDAHFRPLPSGQAFVDHVAQAADGQAFLAYHVAQAAAGLPFLAVYHIAQAAAGLAFLAYHYRNGQEH